MIAARWAMLLVAALAMLAALGAMSDQGQPSVLRLEVAAVVAVLSPLLWPGSGATRERTAMRVVAWSLAATASAVLAIVAIAGVAQPLLPIALVASMLLAMLIVVHAAVAALEHRWRARSIDADGARELAGRSVAVVFALLGSLPLWLGPLAEVASARRAWAVDLAVALSPVTHLAVVSGSDVLRTTWFYEHSNLSALRVGYPEPTALAWGYGAACAALALFTLARRRPRRLAGPALK